MFINLNVLIVDGRVTEEVRAININYVVEYRYESNEVIVNYGSETVLYEITDDSREKIIYALQESNLLMD